MTNFPAVLTTCPRCGQKYDVSYQSGECPHWIMDRWEYINPPAEVDEALKEAQDG